MTDPDPKDPDDVLDYQVNWATWLGTDTIASASWVVAGGIVKDSESNTTTTHTIWLSGGTDGVRYQITSRIVTASTPARHKDKTFSLLVANQ